MGWGCWCSLPPSHGAEFLPCGRGKAGPDGPPAWFPTPSSGTVSHTQLRRLVSCRVLDGLQRFVMQVPPAGWGFTLPSEARSAPLL